MDWILSIWFISQYLSKHQATLYERELLIYNVPISCNWTWHVISTTLEKRSKLTTNDFKIILSSKTKSGSVNVVFYNLVGPMLIEGWFGKRWIAAGTTLCCFPNPFFALSQYRNWQQMTSSLAPDSSTLRTPGSLEVLAPLCQRGRRDLFCTWGVFGVQLVFFKRDADTDVVHVQRSWSHLLSRWHLRLTGGAYRNPDVHVPGWDQPREKVHRKRSLGGWWWSVAEK